MFYFVYMIKNTNGKLYIGISHQPESRLREHNQQKGSYFTKAGNFEIVFKEQYQTLSEARKREIQIKKWRREKKNVLIKRCLEGLPTKINYLI